MERRMVTTVTDCPGRIVPVGTPITIPKDNFVTITQALGGNYTVTYNGNMVRVDGTDAAALGLEPEVLEFEQPDGDDIVEEQVWDALRTVFDPEIPVDLVNLGLIYKVEIDQSAKSVYIEMTLTAPGCGMGPVITEDVKTKLEHVPNVDKVTVELTFDPPWNNDMLTDEAKLELGML